MNNQEAENTIQEILEEDKVEVKKKKRGRGCFLRLLIIITLLFICVFGFIQFRQKLLDIEAQAVIFARQTVTANGTVPQINTNAKEAGTLLSTETTSPQAEEAPIIETATPDAMMVRTATLAAQLTSVAEFQLTRTPQQ